MFLICSLWVSLLMFMGEHGLTWALCVTEGCCHQSAGGKTWQFLDNSPDAVWIGIRTPRKIDIVLSYRLTKAKLSWFPNLLDPKTLLIFHYLLCLWSLSCFVVATQLFVCVGWNSIITVEGGNSDPGFIVDVWPGSAKITTTDSNASHAIKYQCGWRWSV